MTAKMNGGNNIFTRKTNRTKINARVIKIKRFVPVLQAGELVFWGKVIIKRGVLEFVHQSQLYCNHP